MNLNFNVPQPEFTSGVWVIPEPPDSPDITDLTYTDTELTVGFTWTPATDPYLGEDVSMMYEWSMIVRTGGGEPDQLIYQWTDINEGDIQTSLKPTMVRNAH